MDDDEINLSPVVPVLKAKNLDTLIDYWLLACRKKAKKYTVDGYADDINHFRTWWASVGPSLHWQLRQEDLLTFRQWLLTSTLLGYHSRNDILRRLKQMFRWAYRGGYVKADYSTWVPENTGSPPERVIASASVLVSLVEQATEPLYRAALAVLIGTGMRREECASIRVADVRIDADGSGTIALRTTKNDKPRTVVFDAATGAYLRPWLDSLPPRCAWLFPSTTYPDRHIVGRSLGRGIKRIVKRAGVPGIQGPHDIRRIYVTLNRRQKKDSASRLSLSKQVGHASTVITDRYDYSTEDDRRNDVTSPFAVSA